MQLNISLLSSVVCLVTLLVYIIYNHRSKCLSSDQSHGSVSSLDTRPTARHYAQKVPYLASLGRHLVVRKKRMPSYYNKVPEQPP